MIIITSIFAIFFKLLGVGFLIAAAIGVLRFPDPFQRMHASTKAGTIGAGLILLGAAFKTKTMEGTLIGSIAIIFLLSTMPIAAHLLGRASYISGASMLGVNERDELAGIMKRNKAPLEERLKENNQGKNGEDETV